MEKHQDTNLLDDTNSYILNILLKVLSFVTPPLVVLSLLRIPKLGFLPVMNLHILLGFIVVFCFVFKNRLSYNLKGISIICVFYLIGVGGMLTHSIILYAVPGFIIGTIFCIIFFEKKTAQFFQLIQVLTLSTFLVLNRQNIFQQAFEIVSYIIVFNYYIIFSISKLKQKFFSVIQELERKEVVLQDALNSKSRFLALMSHEIRTPLNGIILSSNELSDLSGDKQKFVNIIKKSGNSLLSVVNDILDISKLDVQKFKLVERVFDINELLNNIDQSYSLITKSKGIDFKLSNKLTHSNFVGDSNRIEQILKNLLNNAVKFTEQGTVCLEVEDLGRDLMQFRISDTGIGVSESKLEHIFDEFEQEEISTSIEYGGTGLGLSIVRKIIELMQGEILFDSEKGVGTTVSISIPLKHTDEKVEVTNDNDHKIFIDVQEISILVAEDDLTNTFLLKSLLSKFGFKNITTVINGKECLNMLETKSFDLLLLDIRMPVMDGLETARVIRKNDKAYSEIPIIGVSANAFDDDIAVAIEAGMNDYLMKPINRNLLYEKIQKLLEL